MKTWLSLICATLVLFQPTVASAASFPQTIKLEEVTTAPMGTEIKSKKYIKYSNDPQQYQEYEERVEKNIMGSNKIFVLREGDKLSTYNQTKGTCTTTDVSAVTGMADGADPGKMAEEMRRAMGLVKAGPCEGAGRPGVLYSSEMGKVCYDKEFEYVVLGTDMMGSKMQITQVDFNVKLPEFALPLPAGMVCQKGPDLEALMSGRGQAGSPSENEQNRPNNDEAMKRAQDALKKMQEMFKGMGQQ